MTAMRVGELVGVYGTLKTGFGNNSYMSGERGAFVRDTRVSGEIYSLGGFPGLKTVVDANEEGVIPFVSEGPTVKVELFRIEKEELPRMLDGLEGYPTFYTRERFQTESGDNAWVYIYNGTVDPDRRVDSGNWGY